MKKIIMLYLGFFSLTPYVFATHCDYDNPGQTGLTWCAAEQCAEAEKKLKLVYEQVLKCTSDEEDALLFKNSQDLWIKQQRMDCDFEHSNSYGGSMYPMLIYWCLTKKTENRIKELKEILESITYNWTDELKQQCGYSSDNNKS